LEFLLTLSFDVIRQPTADIKSDPDENCNLGKLIAGVNRIGVRQLPLDAFLDLVSFY
jgi:hypothetical protein